MATTTKDLYPVEYDLTNCDAEPIHLIRSYQLPTNLLVVAQDTYRVLAASHNATDLFGRPAGELLGLALSELLSAVDFESVTRANAESVLTVVNPLVPTEMRSAKGEALNLILHRRDGLLYLELEPVDPAVSRASFLHRVDLSLQRIQAAGGEANLYDTVVREVKALTGYDRVMLYQFDPEYNGEVVAEAVEDDMTPFLNLRYPHSDIPAQARALFLENQFRHIISTADNGATDIAIAPELSALDLTEAVGRGVSPIHLKYLRNMGVGASLNIAIVVHQQLWGLIACHHRTEKLLDYRLRSMLGFMGKVMSGHLALWQSTRFRDRVLQTSITRSRLFERMMDGYNIIEGIERNVEDLVDLTEATGAVVYLDNRQNRYGECPRREEVSAILDYLDTRPETCFSTESFFETLPTARSYQHPPAGVLSIRLTESPGEYIVWFRPEIVKTVQWGGDPEARKVIRDGRVDLSPEMSFAKYAQRVSGTAAQWERYQTDAALALRNDIKEVILRKYKEVSRLNSQLVDAYEELESFSYTVSHDLRAPLRTIQGFAEILEEDYVSQLDDYGKDALRTIVSSVGKMNQFINDILQFSRLGQNSLNPIEISVENLVQEIWSDLTLGKSEGELIDNLNGIVINADLVLIRQLLFNLLSNALKYSSKGQRARVKVSGRKVEGATEITVADNGIGLDMAHAERIFAVFNRLVSEDQFPGTGIGLAISRRIMDKHQGSISVISAPGEGATFTLRFPDNPDFETAKTA